MNCTKTCLATALRPDPLGSYSTPPDPLAVIRGRVGKKGRKGLGIVRCRKERGGKVVKG